MARKPRVLLVTPTPPYPPDNGGMLRILSLIEALRDRYAFELLTFTRTTGEARFRHEAAALALSTYVEKVYTVPKETADAASSRAAHLPEICRPWYSPEFSERLRRLSRSVDLVHIEFLNMAQYVEDTSGVATVLTEHDLSHLSLFSSYFREWTGLGRWKKVGDWVKTRRYHRQVCRAFDRVVTVTGADMERLAKVVSRERLAHVATGVDLEKFGLRDPVEEDENALVFVGHYPHYPNEDAAVWFCEKVLPRLRRRRPELKLYLVGSHPTPRIRALAGPAVEVTGTVPDVRPYLDKAAVFIAPMRLGWGVKGKVLEAFARGVPVAATPVVGAGIPEARVGQHLAVGRGAGDFARAVLELLQNGPRRRVLAREGRALVERHYAWSESADRLDAVYREALR